MASLPFSMRTARLLLVAGACSVVAPAFVPSVGSLGPASWRAPALGMATATTPTTDNTEDNLGSGALASLGVAFAMLGLGVSRRQRRGSAVPRKATSYRDYQDPWLGSADLGFDPLNVAVGSVFDKSAAAVPETTYYNYRESEVKHGRFAMGAFLAIFAESADRGALMKQLGAAGAQDNLDGTLGLDEVQAPVLLITLGYQALAEFSLQSKEQDGSFLSVEYKQDRCPGDLGFDPLGLGNGGEKKGLHNIEVNTGRLAMIGITAFLFKEFVVKDPTIAAKIL